LSWGVDALLDVLVNNYNLVLLHISFTTEVDKSHEKAKQIPVLRTVGTVAVVQYDAHTGFEAEQLPM